ncbi:MAG: hypothetical protein HQM13_23660 [SAR324 cluster bacterium]|nr:hypothetical protein [SAR324 cluster bacterium]
MKRLLKEMIAVTAGISFVLSGIAVAQTGQGNSGNPGAGKMMGKNTVNSVHSMQGHGDQKGIAKKDGRSSRANMKGKKQSNFFNFLQRDMVSFDQAYIPALALTSQEKSGPSKKAMELLKSNWSGFKKNYYDKNRKDFSWKKDFDHIDELILKADRIVKSGKNLKDAHEELEGIRNVFLALRQRNGINYFVDYLTEFHEPMEGIVLSALKKTPETLTSENVNTIRNLLPQTISLWEKIQKDSFDQELFRFNDSKITQMKKLMKSEGMALEQLQNALEGSDHALLIKRSVAIKPNFAKLFMMFGDFETLKKG